MARSKADCEERSRRWTELVSRWRASGLSQAAFCRELGLNANTFNFWKLRLLRQRPGAKRRSHAAEMTAPATAAAERAAIGGGGGEGRMKFTPVRVIASQSALFAFEVSLCGGRTLRIAPGFDEASLRCLIGVLENSDEPHAANSTPSLYKERRRC